MQAVVNAEMLISQDFQQQCSEYSTADVRIYKCLLYHRLRDHDEREGVKAKPEDGEERCKMLSVLWACVGAHSGRNQLGILWEGLLR